MPIKVIDACAMIAFLRDEPGADVVEKILDDAAEDCVAHVVQFSEVFTWFLKNGLAEKDALEAVNDLQDAGIEQRDDIDAAFWQEVARQRAAITSTVKTPATGAKHAIALADCFAVALARKLAGSVVTSDHHEFDYVHSSGICPVVFFR
jgi:uncharacterized protein with PIN domain